MSKLASIARVTAARLAVAGGLAAAALAGCSQPPPYRPLNHRTVVPLAAGDVWRRIHAFLQDQGIRVVSEDPAAGLIDAHKDIAGRGLLASYATCGGQGVFPPAEPRQSLDLTVRIRPVPDGSEVTAYALFAQTLAARRAGAVTVACPSRGVLENAVLEVASGQPMDAAVVP